MALTARDLKVAFHAERLHCENDEALCVNFIALSFV